MALGAGSLATEWKGLVTLLLLLLPQSSDPACPPLPSSEARISHRFSN